MRTHTTVVLSLVAGAAIANDAPSVAVQANAPGWITINYTHPGTDGAIGFYIEREGTGIVFSSVAASGQLIDTHLEPDTQYAYRACAVYEGDDEPACSSYFSKRTLPANNKPANFDPPLVSDVTIDITKIAITWGPTGDYTKVLLRLDDDRGNLGQWDVNTTPGGYGSFTFQPLQPNTDYHIILKGCTYNVFAGHACGPWSQRFDFRTHGATEPPAPPGKPTLTITGTTASTISLAWSVKLVNTVSGDRAMLYRDRQPYKELEPRSALGGQEGTYTDTVQARHSYHVCYERELGPLRVCSDSVRDPLIRSSSEAEIVASVTPELEKDAAVQPDVSVAGPSFAGAWDTVTSGGGSYRMVLSQSGGQVTGTYEPSSGTIAGTSIARAADGGSVITFTWTERAGSSGTGRFALAADGQSFTGSWSASTDPNMISGTWSGTRAGSGAQPATPSTGLGAKKNKGPKLIPN